MSIEWDYPIHPDSAVYLCQKCGKVTGIIFGNSFCEKCYFENSTVREEIIYAD